MTADAIRSRVWRGASFSRDLATSSALRLLDGTSDIDSGSEIQLLAGIGGGRIARWRYAIPSTLSHSARHSVVRLVSAPAEWWPLCTFHYETDSASTRVHRLHASAPGEPMPCVVVVATSNRIVADSWGAMPVVRTMLDMIVLLERAGDPVTSLVLDDELSMYGTVEAFLREAYPSVEIIPSSTALPRDVLVAAGG